MVCAECIGAVTPRGERSLTPPPSPERETPRAPGGQISARSSGAAPSGPGVYLLLGEETWLADEALEKLLRQLLPQSERDFNLDVLDAAEASVQDIIAKCDTFPFFGTRRVVVVRIRDERDFRPGGLEMLEAYLEQGPPPST